MKVIFLGLAAASVASETVSLFDDDMSHPAELQQAFTAVYGSFLKDFDEDAHAELLSTVEHGLDSFLASRAFNGYAATSARCDSGAAGNTPAITGLSAYPGGAVGRVHGFDLAQLVDKLASQANGPAAAAGVFPGLLAQQGMATGASMIQGLISTALQVIPPLISPPAWNNQPLPCLPMLTGHNCFGATPYLITAADFMTADTTDSQLDGTIAAFPSMYASKVGKTSDKAYQVCFASFMSMQCASLFPRCATAQAREEPSPVGRVPMCFTHCLATLVACPGFWVDDIADVCSTVSVPPACTMATFTNLAILPPQLSSGEEQASSFECPATSF